MLFSSKWLVYTLGKTHSQSKTKEKIQFLLLLIDGHWQYFCEVP